MNIVRNPMAAVAFVLITGWYLVRSRRSSSLCCGCDGCRRLTAHCSASRKVRADKHTDGA